MTKCPSTLRCLTAAFGLAAFVPLTHAATLTAASVASTPAAPPELRLQAHVPKGGGSIDFFATGWPSALTIHGHGKDLDGEFAVQGTTISGTMTVELDSLDTGIGLRNKHMRETYLETGKYPRAVLTLTRVDIGALPQGDSFKPLDVPFQGLLELHGTKRPVAGSARISRAGARLDVAASFELTTTEFGIAPPHYMGISMAEKVKVNVGFSAPIQANIDERGRDVARRD